MSYLKLVESVIAKFRGSKQEACLQHTDGCAGRDSVKILHDHFLHLGLRILERDSIDVAILTLQRKTRFIRLI